MRICKGLGLFPVYSTSWSSNCDITSSRRISRQKINQFWTGKGGSMGPISHKLGVRDRLMTIPSDPFPITAGGSKSGVEKVEGLS